MLTISRPGRWALTLAVAILALPRPGSSTTVLRVDMDFLLEQATLVFEGRVVASEASWNPEGTAITTEVRFAIEEIIKGAHPHDSLTLRFSGGTVDGMTLHVGGMIRPGVGERGIYFVESLARDQVNPLLGWGQGHFRLLPDDGGTLRVVTENGTPVAGLEPADTRRAAGPRSPFSHGVAGGLRLHDPAAGAGAALDRESFKRALRARLSALGAAAPAGAR